MSVALFVLAGAAFGYGIGYWHGARRREPHSPLGVVEYIDDVRRKKKGAK